ncbi:MAG: hypothetical protein MCM46_07655 [Candidatus Manganitrophus sp. SB1]|nr:hypothetical protein [Candidatus Manganitrophus morganii]
MKKKALIGAVGMVLVGLGVLAYLAAPYVATPVFSAINSSREPVQVMAYWRNESKNLGTVAPGQKFKVNAEAAISFKAKFLNGRELASSEMYFTSGTSIEADITESGIELRYASRT